MKTQLLAFSVLLLLANHAQAADLSARQIKKSAQYCINKSSCHTQEIAYLGTNNAAIDNWTINQLKKSLKIKDFNNSTLRGVAKRRVGNDISDYQDCKMHFIDSFEFYGQSPKYAVLGEEAWEYTCGAHGNGTHTLYVVQKSGNIKPLSLKQIMLPNKHKQLEQLQFTAFKHFLATEGEMNATEIAEYLKEWKFEPTNNWRLAKGGLVFQFQSYEVTPYAMGRPEIFITNKDLHGIIREDILREAAQYRGK